MVSGLIDTFFTEWHSTFYGGIGQLLLLLDHHQEVLDIFSEDTTQPRKIQPPVSNAPLDSTWRNYQSARYYRYRCFYYLSSGSYLVHHKSTSKIRRFKSSNMPKASKKSVREQSPPPSDDHNSTDSAETSDSDHNQDPEVSFHPCGSTQSGSCYVYAIYWGTQDELDGRRWSLPQIFKMAIEVQNNSQLWISKSPYQAEMYVSWNIPKDALTLDTIWNKFEEFSKPQTNKVRAHFDLLTSFHQGTRNMDEWYNAIQAQVNLAKYPPETAKILHRDIFLVFSCEMKILSWKPSTRAMLISRNFQPVKCANWPKRWKAQKPRLNIFNRLQGKYQQPRYN